MGKESTGNAGDAGDAGWILGLGRPPGGGHGNSLQYSCLENPHGQRSLVGYSPRGHKGSDTTEAIQHVIVMETIRAHLFGFTKRKTENPLPSSSSGKGGNPANPRPLCW